MNPRAFFDRLRRPAFTPAVIAALVAIFLGVVADGQQKQLALARARTEALSELNLIQDRLEGDVRGEVQLVRGLVADIASRANLDPASFNALCEHVLRSDYLLRNIAVSPGLVVAYECPLKGNEKAIGLDLSANADQRAAALRARDSGDAVLAGPVDLVQGGRGFIARPPATAVTQCSPARSISSRAAAASSPGCRSSSTDLARASVFGAWSPR